MNTLLLVSFNVIDQDKTQQYAAAVAPTLTKFGGQLATKGKALTLDGESQYKMRTIIAFENRENAEQWYHSADYQSIIPLRKQAMDAQLTLVG